MLRDADERRCVTSALPSFLIFDRCTWGFADGKVLGCSVTLFLYRSKREFGLRGSASSYV